MKSGPPTSLVETDRLAHLAEIARQLDLPRLRDDALAVAGRADEGRFFVACVGQFKRGKSTLIDALLDDPVLPSGIVPITAVPDRRAVRRAADRARTAARRRGRRRGHDRVARDRSR